MMKSVLIINTAGLGIGGITTNMLNYINLTKNNYKYTVLSMMYNEKKIINQLENMGCDVKYFPNRKKSIFKYIIFLINLLRQNKYDIIHVHGNSATMGLELLIAKYYKIPIRIAHNHNMICNHIILHQIMNVFFRHSYTKAVACSSRAGDWIFGIDKYIILNNAIDIYKYKYNENVRILYRKKLGISDDTLLIGHIGNFIEQKNHKFILDIMKEMKKYKKIYLVLLGNGELYSDIKTMINNLNLEKEIYMPGYVNDTENWLQAMDVFILPSKWEGLPFVLVEAQCAGLKCIVSDKISDEANIISENYIKLPLSKDEWIYHIKNIEVNKDRKEAFLFMKEARFDINELKNDIIRIYEG